MVNNIKFEKRNPQISTFYKEHGWVVIKNIFNSNEILDINLNYNKLMAEYANQMNISIDDYITEINHWRDLSMKKKSFKSIVFNRENLQQIVRKATEWESIQFLQDQLISKSIKNNGVVPWHQDSMYWPIDTSFCSSWIPMQEVDKDAGCLEVIDKSHTSGCFEPYDFIQESKDNISIEGDRILLPVKSGEVILLHSLLWHRSSLNYTLPFRKAYIILWMHPTSKWCPELVAWHPINNYIESPPNEYIRGERFPIFENVNYKSKHINQIIRKRTFNKIDGVTMFDSSKIGKQFTKILKKKGYLADLLSSRKNREKIIKSAIDDGVCYDKEFLSNSLQKLWICSSAYKNNYSRNVFSTAYSEWWNKVGKIWEAKIDNSNK